MRVAALQLDIANGDPATTLARAGALADAAAAAGANLLVLPEVFATGWAETPQRAVDAAPAAHAAVVGIARRHRCWVVAGLAEAGPRRPFNSCVVIDPDGTEAARYRKVHLFSLTGEERRYEAGDRVSTLVVGDLRVTPLICYDLRFPELFRATALATDLYTVIANWPSRRGHPWRTLLQARAMDAQAWVLGVNRVGADGQGIAHGGDSAVVDPTGERVASLAGQPGVVLADVHPERVRETRARYGFLADRRPQVYGDLERG
jgi:predicted amidohydrolase